MLTIMQMVNMRRGAKTSQQGAENNPPPPPQTLAEVVAQQTQILHMLAQKQGSKTVREYVQAFNHLSRYAPNHVDTDDKKKECFLEGMTPKLQSHLGHRFESFNELVDDAIEMEEDLRLHHLEKRKSKD